MSDAGLYVLFSRRDPDDAPQGAAELAYQLRGGPVFEMLAQHGVAVWAPRDDGGVKVPTSGDNKVVFASLPLLIDNPGTYHGLLEASIPMIVDVHFPLMGAEHILAIQPGVTDDDRDESLDVAATELWSEPVRRRAAFAVLGCANAITSPRKDWAAPLDRVLSTPVVVVPDVRDPQSGGRFMRKFGLAMELAMGTNRAGRLAKAPLRVLAARDVRKWLAAADIDWSGR